MSSGVEKVCSFVPPEQGLYISSQHDFLASLSTAGIVEKFLMVRLTRNIESMCATMIVRLAGSAPHPV
jgi:hypothetical protein